MKKTNGSFKGYNPFALKRYLDKLCGPVGYAKATRDVHLIMTLDKDQTEHLLKVNSLDGFPVTVSLSEKVKSVAAVCRSDDLTGLNNQDLLRSC